MAGFQELEGLEQSPTFQENTSSVFLQATWFFGAANPLWNQEGTR